MAAVIAASALLARALFGSQGVVAAWLVALSPVMTAGGAYARFYMPFAALCTLTLIAASRMRERPHLRVWFVIGCLVARSLHEFGMLLALVPAAAWLCAESDRERRSAAWLLLITTAALAAEHSLLVWLPCTVRACADGAWGLSSTGFPAITAIALPVAAQATPAELITAIAVAGIAAVASYRRIGTDLIFVVAAGGAAAVFANGVVAALVVLWSIARPHDAGKFVGAGLLAVIAGSLAWIALMHLRSDALVDANFVGGLLRSSFIYPWSGGEHFATRQPLVSAAIVLGVWRGVVAPTTPRSAAARTMAMLLLVELLSFGVSGIDVRSRFVVLLMPLLAVFAGGGVLWLTESAAQLMPRRPVLAGRLAGVGMAIAAVALIVVEQASAIIPHRDPGADAGWWAKWSPPVALSSLALDRNTIGGDAVIVANDELAALLVLGRVDFWWPPDATSAERYGFAERRPGEARGIYAGATVLADSTAVQRLIRDRGGREVVVALFNTGKFGFDRSTLQVLIDQDDAVELEKRPDDWLIARFRPRP